MLPGTMNCRYIILANGLIVYLGMVSYMLFWRRQSIDRIVLGTAPANYTSTGYLPWLFFYADLCGQCSRCLLELALNSAPRLSAQTGAPKSRTMPQVAKSLPRAKRKVLASTA